MPQCKYCRRKYRHEDWASILQPYEHAPSLVCPDCYFKLQSAKQMGHDLAAFGKQLWNAITKRGNCEDSGCWSGPYGDEEVPIEEEKEITRCKGAHKRKDGVVVVTGDLDLDDFYDYEKEDLDCTLESVELVIRPKGRIIVRSCHCEFIALTIRCTSAVEWSNKPVIEVRGALQLHNCQILGDGGRPFIVNKGHLFISNCKIDNFSSSRKSQGVIASVSLAKNDGISIIDSAFINCKSCGPLISAKGDIDAFDLKFETCKCNGPMAFASGTLKAEKCEQKDCQFGSSEGLSISAAEFVSICLPLVQGHHSSEHSFQVQYKELCTAILPLCQTASLKKVNKDRVWQEIFSRYKTLPRSINKNSMGKILECLWLLVSLYTVKVKRHRAEHDRLIEKVFSKAAKEKDTLLFWERVVEPCFCKILAVHQLAYLEGMPDAVRDAILK